MTNPRLEELRAKFQENPRRYFAPFANELRKAGDPAQAISVCRTHLAGQPGHVSGHIVLGQALYEAGESSEARDVFTAALALDPENLIALRSLGEIAQVKGEFGAARQWYQRLLDADPRNNEVSQLLRDIPADVAPKPIEAAPLEAAEEPTPFTIREEVAAAEAAPSSTESASAEHKVHTGFTGSGPAYKSAEDRVEEARAKQAQEAPLAEAEDAFIDLQPTAHDRGVESRHEAAESAAASSESEPLEMVDIGEESEAFAAEATLEAMPVESFDYVDATASDSLSDGFESYSGIEVGESDSLPSSGELDSQPEPDFETVESYNSEAAGDAIPSLEIEDFAADALSPASAGEDVATNAMSMEPTAAEETSEPPRATFAERGFDGPVDEMGWMTTPSQAFSDLEAAPENWLEEMEEDAPAVEAAAPEPAAAETRTPEDHTTDSWFDETPGAAAIEATEVSSDELWLPPELPHVTNAEANAYVPDESEPTAEVASDAQSWSASTNEDPPAVIAEDEVVSEWAPPRQAVPQTQAIESIGITGEESAEPTYAPDETAQPVEAASEQSAYEFDSYDVDYASGDAEATSATAEVAENAEAGVSAGHTEADAPPEFVYASTGDMPSSGSAIGQTPSDAILPPAPAPFLTETLAELYLQQGFRDEALSIYRQLLDRNPSNADLKSRIAALEQRDVPTPSPGPTETRSAGQSVRTFFSRLARRSPVVPRVVDSPGSGGSGEGEPQTDVPFSAAASALANLFTASKPPQADEGAASTLAGAFTDPAGRPSRAAERELSLDHLFRDVAPGGPAAGGVTLDEFYSTPNSGTGSTTEPGSEAGSEEGTDIRQFTAWLEGLRKK